MAALEPMTRRQRAADDLLEMENGMNPMTRWAPLAAAMSLAAAPALAAPQAVGYTAPDGVNTVAVSAGNGLPISCLSGCTSAVGAATASAAISTASAATVLLAAASAGKAIYVSHFDFIAAGTTNVTLSYGSNCASSQTALTGGYNLTAQTGISAGNGGAPMLFVPAGNALCLVNSAAVQVSGAVAYAQQ